MYYAGSFGPKRLLNDELRQLDEEGFIVSDELKYEALQFEDVSSFEKFQAFYDKLKKLPKKPDFDFYEPNSLSDILAARPAKRIAPKTFSNDFDTLYDRYLGAWLGRCAGCALGKPVEFNVNENYINKMQLYSKESKVLIDTKEGFLKNDNTKDFWEATYEWYSAANYNENPLNVVGNGSRLWKVEPLLADKKCMGYLVCEINMEKLVEYLVLEDENFYGKHKRQRTEA